MENDMSQKINLENIQTKPHHGIRHRPHGAFVLKDGKMIPEKEFVKTADKQAAENKKAAKEKEE